MSSFHVTLWNDPARARAPRLRRVAGAREDRRPDAAPQHLRFDVVGGSGCLGGAGQLERFLVAALRTHGAREDAAIDEMK